MNRRARDKTCSNAVFLLLLLIASGPLAATDGYRVTSYSVDISNKRLTGPGTYSARIHFKVTVQNTSPTSSAWFECDVVRSSTSSVVSVEGVAPLLTETIYPGTPIVEQLAPSETKTAELTYDGEWLDPPSKNFVSLRVQFNSVPSSATPYWISESILNLKGASTNTPPTATFSVFPESSKRGPWRLKGTASDAVAVSKVQYSIVQGTQTLKSWTDIANVVPGPQTSWSVDIPDDIAYGSASVLVKAIDAEGAESPVSRWNFTYRAGIEVPPLIRAGGSTTAPSLSSPKPTIYPDAIVIPVLGATVSSAVLVGVEASTNWPPVGSSNYVAWVPQIIRPSETVHHTDTFGTQWFLIGTPSLNVSTAKLGGRIASNGAIKAIEPGELFMTNLTLQSRNPLTSQGFYRLAYRLKIKIERPDSEAGPLLLLPPIELEITAAYPTIQRLDVIYDYPSNPVPANESVIQDGKDGVLPDLTKLPSQCRILTVPPGGHLDGWQIESGNGSFDGAYLGRVRSLFHDVTEIIDAGAPALASTVGSLHFNSLFWYGQKRGVSYVTGWGYHYQSQRDTDEATIVNKPVPFTLKFFGLLDPSEIDLAQSYSVGTGTDTTPPSLIILKPLNGTKVRAVDPTFTVSGTAADSVRVARVEWRKADSPVWNVATTQLSIDQRSCSWHFDATGLIHGQSYSYFVRAIDAAGNRSGQKLVAFTYAALRELKVATLGAGAVTPGFLGTTLREVGTNIVITATAKAGNVFQAWSGTFSDDHRALSIAMPYQNVDVTAKFIPNPFPGLVGTYCAGIDVKGIITDDSQPLDPNLLGLATFTLASNGSFSGEVKISGTTYSVLSAFNGLGKATATLKPSASIHPTWEAVLELDLTGQQGIHGTLTTSTSGYPVVTFLCAHALTNTSAVRLPQQGTFNMLMKHVPPFNSGPQPPFGVLPLNGFLTSGGYSHSQITISKTGSTMIAGRSCDGSAWTFSGYINLDRIVNVFSRNSTTKGITAARLYIGDAVVENGGWGAGYFYRPNSTNPNLPYSYGISTPLGATISGVYSPAEAQRAYVSLGPDSITPNARFRLWDELGTTAIVHQDVIARSDGRILLPTGTPSSKLSVSVGKFTGQLSGTFADTDGKVRSVTGIGLQHGAEFGGLALLSSGQHARFDIVPSCDLDQRISFPYKYEFPDAPPFELPSTVSIGTKAFTMSIWFRPDGLRPGIEQTFFRMGRETTHSSGFLGVLRDSEVTIYYMDDAGLKIGLSLNRTVAATAKSHLTYVLRRLDSNGTTVLSLILDGVSVSTAPLTMGPQNTTQPLVFGAYYNPTAGENQLPFYGTLSDIRGYSRALSDAEIAQLDYLGDRSGE